MHCFPLTKTEYGIYIEHITRQNTAYNLPFLVTLGRDTDIGKLTAAIKTAVSLHPCLNTAFTTDESGNVCKYIVQRDVTVSVIDQEQPDFDSLITPFDLEHGPLYRFYIIRSQGQSYFFFDIHHIVFDGFSADILFKQINSIYQGIVPPAETFTANDLAAEEQERLASEEYQKARQYYLDTFDGIDTDTTLYQDKNEREPLSKELVYQFTSVDSPLLKALAAKHRVRLSTVFNAAFAILLAKHTGGSQVLFSTVHHGRDSRLSESIGMFVKTYPVYADLSKYTEIGEFLTALDAHILQNRENDLYSFADFAAETRLSPNVLFSYQGDMFSKGEFCGSLCDYQLLPVRDEKSGFELTVRRHDGKFTGYAEYRQDLYDDEIIRTMLESFEKLLLELTVRDKLSELDMLTDSELAVLDSFNHREKDYEITDIVTLFRRQAQKTPDNTAVVFLDTRLTYRETDRISENIAAYLRSKGIGSGRVVSVLIPRCEYMVTASLGVLKSGAGYQPLDPSYPVERLTFMVKDADAGLVIADRSLMDRLPSYTGEVLYLDEIPSLPDAAPIEDHPSPDDLFIMLYTSGSTGVPKGVMLEHHNLCCFCHWFIDFYRLDENARTAAYASYGFDADMMDLYPTLLSGGQVHIIDEAIRLDLLAIKNYFYQNEITHSFMTTQVGRQYADMFPDAEYPRYLSTGGEKLVPVAPPHTYRFFNAYGPTECTIFTNLQEVDRLYDRVPIGRQLDNLKQYVVDKDMRRVPAGVPGELIVSGHQVGRGYLNRPEQNEKAFIRNPFCDQEGYEKAYRTGDIVRFLSDGRVDFVGRNDGQVKIRGFRIELSEVESIIRRFPDIRDATVQAFEESGGGKFIAAYIVSDQTIDIDALNAFIAENKPPYMVPAVTMQIEKIPLNQNQKVNKRALPIPEKKAEDMVPPANGTQQRIFDCIASVIGSTAFGITTDIFYAGLTSIGAIKLNVLLSREFGVPVSISDLKKNNTITALERFLSVSGTGEAYDILPDYPLTQTQNGIFVECISDPKSTVYNIPYLFRLSEKLDPEKLKTAVEAAISAHPYLSAVLFMNDAGDIRVKREDDAKPEVELIRTEKLPDQMVTPFRLLGGRLYRARIYQIPGGSYLFLEFHHIVCDGTSELVMLEDITAAYRGESLSRESYTGFEAALDEEKKRASDAYQKAKEYYEALFSGTDADMLPSRDVNGKENTSAAFTVDSALDHEKIKAFCREKSVTENAFYNSVFAFVTGKYCYKTETVHTTIYNGRNDSRLARSVTMLVKTFPVYCRLTGETSVTELVQTTGRQLMDSMSHDVYSFAEISRAFDIPADIMFVYQGDSFAFDSIGGEKAEMHLLSLSDAKAPLNINLFLRDGRVQFSCEYRSNYYSESFMRRFIKCLEKTAEEFISKEYLKDVVIMTDDEKAVIDGFNATEAEIPYTTCNKLLEEQVRKYPDKKAVIAGGESLTYTQLNECANRIAHGLIENGCRNDDMIGVMMPRTVYAYAVREGVLKAGGAFMPLAPDYPDDRVSYIIENSGSAITVTTEALAHERRQLFADAGIKVLTVEALLQNPGTDNPDTGVKPENLCYCIYTSGSTGKPKGVMIEHHSLVNFVDWNRKNLQACEFCDNMTVSLALAALTFDVSVLEESLGLYHGGTVAMATEDEINNPILLSEMLERNGVDVMKCTPSYMNNLLDVPQAVKVLRNMKAIDIGAEAFPAPLYDKMRAAGITAKIHNGYGPTEATITTSMDYVTSSRITIGQPLCNTKVVMLDAFDHELPVDVPGELTILGDCVGRGYVANEKLTREKFITYQGYPAYRSGDLARWGEDGKILFMGRMDNQVKLRGLRIELDEIENVMNSYPSVNRSVVLVKENEKAGQFLCAYFTAGEPIDPEELSAHMGKSLAKYMVPSVFVQLDAIPLTNNGKVDKKSLPEPELKVKEREYIAPQNPLQEKLADMFAYALGSERVGINENFFELGGTSLTASKIAVRAMMENLPIAFKDVFDYPTVLAMEKYISSHSDTDTASAAASEEAVNDTGVLSRNTADFVTQIKETAEDIGDVLLTGATGFLGIHVLKHLISSTNKKIFCLLRSGQIPAEDRLRNMLMYYFDTPFKPLFGKRLFVIEGDITDKEKVLSLGSYSFKTVINCAACVKHFVKDDTLDRINFHGVENLIDLCVENHRRLVQISTVSVAGSSVNNQFPPERVIHENELFFGQNLENKYVHTKFKAEEALLRAVSERGLDGKIIRVGNLMSRYSDGEFQINSVTNGFMSSLRAYAALGKIMVGALDSIVEFSPIDCTAAAVVTLAGAGRDFTVFHATNGHRVQMGDVIEAMDRAGIKVQIVSDEEFNECFDAALRDEKLSPLVSPLISYLASDKNTIEFYIGHDNSFTTKALYRLGFKWPIINETYLKNLFVALDTLGYFDEV